MRKKLLFCSALLLSASLAGCGYNDDNVRETVPALPESCSSSNECFSGSAGGVCVEGHCLRACEDRTDCEDGTICESGLCRHIVPCPTMDFTNDYRKFQNSKCLKVFSHTPTTNWTDILLEDVCVTSVPEDYASTNFTSKYFTFQIPNRTIAGGLIYSLVAASALTFIVLENMASTLFMQCVMPDNATDPESYAIELDPRKSLDLKLDSLLSICKEISGEPGEGIWADDFSSATLCSDSSEYMKRFSSDYRNEILLTRDSYNVTISHLNLLLAPIQADYDRLECSKQTTLEGECEGLDKRIKNVKGQIKTIEDRIAEQKNYNAVYRCSQAELAWKTLSKVYGVVAEATLSDQDRTTTRYTIDWIEQLLKNGTTKIKTLPAGAFELNNISDCSTLISNMQTIQGNICNNIMYGLSDNPMVRILASSNMDLVSCLTNQNTAISLVKSGLDLVNAFGNEETLAGIAKTLMAVLASGNQDLASYFSSLKAMVEAIGDSTWIWITNNAFQELNIISNQTNNNPFNNNELMLAINYIPQSTLITHTPVSINAYGSGDVTYDSKNGIPKTTDKAKLIGTNQVTQASGSSATISLLSPKSNNSGIYEFYLNPTTNGKTLTCGGVVLDISAIDGYVVLTDDQINSMNGTALIVETPK